MIRFFKRLWFKYKQRKMLYMQREIPNNVPIVDGIFIPVVRSIKYRTGMNESAIKKQIVDKMASDIKPYIVWSQEIHDDVSVITGRVDVLRRDRIE